ncbi:unnamed protein product [Closterium sp. NIES-64]|nr:unnamed protein product [Closterium sp. NIES-64]
MVRLTADLILESPQYFNAVREREIDLRGNKIAVIENLGATEDRTAQDLFDSIDLSDNDIVKLEGIDLSDNEIVKLEGFPLLRRLSTLLLCNNRITRISPQLAHLSKLQTLVLANNRLTNLADLNPLTLVLANNRLTNLADLDPLASRAHSLTSLSSLSSPFPSFLVASPTPQAADTRSRQQSPHQPSGSRPAGIPAHSLTSLSLLDNTVVKKPKYRLYAIHLLPKLRLLDFRKVKLKKPKYRLYEIHLLPKLRLLDFQKVKLKKPKYRLYAIHLLPKLRLLDFREVKLKEWQGVSVTFGKDRAAAVAVMPERQEAEATFGKDRAAAAAAKRVSANTFVPGEALAEAGGAGAGGEGAAAAGGAGGDGGKEGREGAAATAVAAKGPTPEQITAIKVKVPPMCEGEGPFHAAISTAQTLEEVARLEKALQSGQLPSDIKVPSADTDKTSQPME